MRPGREILCGMAELEKLTGRDARTIRRWAARQGFPAACIDGRWQALRREVEGWISRRIATKGGHDTGTATCKR